MTRIQAHRGPDDEGTWETRLSDGTWVGLGSRRLAILDLSPAGHMPMSDENGLVHIAYNGEVYNFPELKRELEARGHRFRSHTDTEVLLRLYLEEGPASIERLNGMFSLAVWDSRKEELFLARDPFGVKPLYFIQQRERFAFASEMKALFQLPGMPREVDPEALHQYLTLSWVPDPGTMLRGIRKLPAGHCAFLRRGELTIRRYWDVAFPPAGHRYSTDLPELIGEVRSRFRAAVRSQMVSDVPVGAFLSSGLDSSSIVAMMAEISAQPVPTYTVTFPPAYRRGELTLDDVAVARRFAERYGCNHHEIVVEPDVADLLPKTIWHMDEPVSDPAAIMAYLVCREASQSTTVLLSGIGGDEIFAGYRKHLGHGLAGIYQKIPRALRRHLIEPATLALPSLRGTPLKGYVRLAKKMARSGSLPPHERFLMDSVYFTDAHKSRLYSERLGATLENSDALAVHRAHYGEVAHADFLHQMLYLDTKAFMVSLNLTYNDKMSMASSVEVRVPFLDRELVEFVSWHVPPELKLHGSTTKYILREAMRDSLPREVLEAKKAGFGAPVDYWLANELRPMVDDLLSDDTVRARGHFRPAAVRDLVREHRDGRQDWSWQIWQLLTLEIWLQNFVDAPPGGSLSPPPVRVHSEDTGAALSGSPDARFDSSGV